MPDDVRVPAPEDHIDLTGSRGLKLLGGALCLYAVVALVAVALDG